MTEPRRVSWRGGHSGRLEALTDAVFGFAITLLVVSLEVPDSFDELVALLKGFVSFAGSFAILIVVWGYHYQFFKHYALEDRYTIVLNSVLLFVVLFYVYPLKFLFQAWSSGQSDMVGTFDNLRLLFTVYGLGYCAVFLVFLLLYRHAYRMREPLQLSAIELVDTRARVASCLVMIGVGLLSIAIAQLAPEGPLIIAAGPAYASIGLFQWLVGRHYNRLRAAASLSSAATPAEVMASSVH